VKFQDAGGHPRPEERDAGGGSLIDCYMLSDASDLDHDPGSKPEVTGWMAGTSRPQ
jgi:hypothetical protein